MTSPVPDDAGLERALALGPLNEQDYARFREMHLKHLYGYLPPAQWQEFWELEHRYELCNLDREEKSA
jgi:hypothetical protein